MPNTIYKNSALAEVIAEVRWELSPVKTVPNGALDPYYLTLRKKIAAVLAQHGFNTVENLVPDDLPLELIPWKPTVRYRKEPNVWPVYQLGPGLFTVNYADGYLGWEDFSTSVRRGLEWLFESFPAASELMKITHFQLTYIDIFTKDQGYEDFSKFASSLLPIQLPFADDFIGRFGDAKSIAFKSEINFPTITPAESKGQINISPGMKGSKNGLMVQFSVATKTMQPEIDSACEWLGTSHAVLKDMFESAISDDLRAILNPTEI